MLIDGEMAHLLKLKEIHPSDLKMPDSEPHILFQFKEKNAAE
jgi:hypothetical protein